jgi:hypothetical protein
MSGITIDHTGQVVSESRPADNTPPPGIYEGVDFAEYASWRAVNNSSLGPALISAAHYKAAKEQTREETDALAFGSLVHAAKLDPKELLNRYVVMPDFTEQLTKEYKNPRASKEYKEKVAAWKEQNTGKTVVTQQQYDEMVPICVAIDQSQLARELLGHDGPAEVSILWQDPRTGLMCKGRIDKLDHKTKRFADLKTAQSVSDFSRTIAQRGYHRQGAFYADGLRILLGDTYEPWLIPVEKTPPHTVMPAPLHHDALVAGRHQYRTALQRIATSKQTGNYAGPPVPSAWTVPEWAQPSVTLFGRHGGIIL